MSSIVVSYLKKQEIRRRKREKRQSIFGLTYDLRYFFDDFLFYVFSPQHFRYVNSKKQPRKKDGFDCSHCQVLDPLAYAMWTEKSFG